MKINALNCIDFYKVGHIEQYPEGTSLVVSNFTPRSGRHANVTDKENIIFFGLQYFMKEFLGEIFSEFFKMDLNEAIVQYRKRVMTALNLENFSSEHMTALHNLGYLPIEIRALPEGSVVPVGIPCLTIHSTHPDFFWLVNYLETILSSYLWLGCTSATTAWNYRKLVDEYAKKTGSPAWFSDFQCHDFSFRGMGSLQAACVSGAAHLLFFKGTDTVPAIDFLEQYYNPDPTTLIGASVPATEHSVMCMGGEEDELETFRRLILKVYPKGIVSIVSDTWDFYKVLTEYAPALHQEIMSRDGKLVFRPDSGNPVDIICGEAIVIKGEITDEAIYAALKLANNDTRPLYFVNEGNYYEMWMDANGYRYKPVSLRASLKGAVECLWETFGGTITETGHKLLDPHVGLIYGDSITPANAKEILQRLEAKGFASANIVFGVGSYTYQYVTRDTWGWAVKATFGVVNGEERNIYKCPKTDDGAKKSAKGLLYVFKDPSNDKKIKMIEGVSWRSFTDKSNLLQPVYRDGNILKTYTLEQLRGEK